MALVEITGFEIPRRVRDDSGLRRAWDFDSASVLKRVFLSIAPLFGLPGIRVGGAIGVVAK